MKLHALHGEPAGSFAKEEYDRRFERARVLMAEQGIDALLITQHENHAYFTGMTGYDINWARWYYFWPVILIIPRAQPPEVIAHSIYTTAASLCYDFKNVEIWEDVARGTEPPYIQILQDRLEKLGLAKAPIGCELGQDFRMEMPFNDFQTLRGRLRHAQLVDGTPIVRELRMIKSEAEVAYLRRACQIQDQAIDVMRESLHEGMSGT